MPKFGAAELEQFMQTLALQQQCTADMADAT